jgi:hypothetical protein
VSATAAFIAGYKPIQFTDFSAGLNLRDKADAVADGEAIDLLNVTFTERGAIRQRDGTTDLTPSDLAQRVDSMTAHYTAAGFRQLVLGAGTRLDMIDETGVVRASQTGLTGGPWTFTQFGDPTHEYVYAANGADPLVRFNGAAWSLGATLATVNGTTGQALPRAGAVCVTAAEAGSSSATNASNRLIATAFGTQTVAGPGGAQSTPSRVFFSNAGQPEVWETDGDPGDVATNRPARGRNYIDLTPGDGETIIAAVTWRELVFVFKQTKFFILWGESAQTDGTPIFQRREVVNSIGLASAQAVAVGRDGVYFSNRRGVYRTSGGDPVLLSDVVSPMWTQDPDTYFTSRPINLGALDKARMLWHMERLYLAVPTGSASANDRVLVYDTQHGWWSLYDLPAAALASFRSGPLPEVHFGYSSGPPRVGRLALNTTTDRGATIRSLWRSGWGDYGNSQVKTIRENKVWGSGVVTVSFAVDFNRTQRANLTAVFGILGTWPFDGAGTWTHWLERFGGRWPGSGEISRQIVRYAVRGTVFSTQFSNNPLAPAWSVHRIARHLREVREPSVR